MKLLLSLALLTLTLSANQVEIVKVTAKEQSKNTYTFHVTLKHEDSSWSHYADSWSVLDANKKLISKRVLWHPHEHEQPFRRSQSGIKIAENTKFVYIRAHDKVHGFTQKLYKYFLK